MVETQLLLAMKVTFQLRPVCISLMLVLFATTNSWSQSKSGNFILPEGDPLVLARYGTDFTREIKQGTFLKVFKYDAPKVSAEEKSEAKGINKISSAFTGKVMLKGQFYEVSGDTLTMVHRGDVVHVDIDEIVMIKQYYSPFRRVVGSGINAFGLYGLTLGSALGIAGVITAVEGNGNGFGALFFFSGVIVGGAGFLVHKLGLLLRRSKYDLNETWYINRTASAGG